MRESAQAQRAFSDYLAQSPPRSLARLAQEYRSRSEGVVPTRQLSRLQLWSQQHAWQERVKAHEARLQAERDAEDAERRRKMREARIGVAVEMQRIGLLALREKQPADISAPAAVSILHEAHDTQRRDLGEPDQRVEVGGADGGPIVFEVRRVSRGDSAEPG